MINIKYKISAFQTMYSSINQALYYWFYRKHNDRNFSIQEPTYSKSQKWTVIFTSISTWSRFPDSQNKPETMVFCDHHLNDITIQKRNLPNSAAQSQKTQMAPTLLSKAAPKLLNSSLWNCLQEVIEIRCFWFVYTLHTYYHRDSASA